MTKLLLTFLLLSASTASAAELTEVTSAAEALSQFHKSSSIRLLNVWATWCAPCVAEMKDLEEVGRKWADRGLEVVGISMDDVIPGDRDSTKRKVARFLSTRSITFTNVYYVGREGDLMEELGFEGEIPVTVLFDRSGKELLRIQGAIDMEKLNEELAALFERQR